MASRCRMNDCPGGRYPSGPPFFCVRSTSIGRGLTLICCSCGADGYLRPFDWPYYRDTRWATHCILFPLPRCIPALCRSPRSRVFIIIDLSIIFFFFVTQFDRARAQGRVRLPDAPRRRRVQQQNVARTPDSGELEPFREPVSGGISVSGYPLESCERAESVFPFPRLSRRFPGSILFYAASCQVRGVWAGTPRTGMHLRHVSSVLQHRPERRSRATLCGCLSLPSL